MPQQTVPDQQYGKAGEQQAALRAVPMGAPPPPATGPVASSPATGTGAVGPGGATPLGPTVVPLTDPTARPGEPVTAGVPVGPGAGPEALGGPPGLDSDLRVRLGAMYQAFPTEELRELIEMLDEGP